MREYKIKKCWELDDDKRIWQSESEWNCLSKEILQLIKIKENFIKIIKIENNRVVKMYY